MLRRVIALSQGILGGDDAMPLTPLETLDGFGRAGPPPNTAVAIDGGAFASAVAGPGTPPGFYGRGSVRRALNLSAGVEELRPVTDLPSGVETVKYSHAREVDLQPWLLCAAIVLGLVDLAISLFLRGLVRRPRPGLAALAIVILFAQGLPAKAGGKACQRYGRRPRRQPRDPSCLRAHGHRGDRPAQRCGTGRPQHGCQQAHLGRTGHTDSGRNRNR